MRKKKYYIGKNKLGTHPVKCIDKLPRMLRPYYSMLFRLKFAEVDQKMNINGSFGSIVLRSAAYISSESSEENEEVNRFLEESLKKRREMKEAYNTGGWQTVKNALTKLHRKP